MPAWNDILKEIQGYQAAVVTAQGKALRSLDLIRRKYLAELHNKTKRNIIAYYSAFLTKSAVQTNIIENERGAAVIKSTPQPIS